MPIIIRLERLLQVCKPMIAVLGLLFGLLSFIPLAGAGVHDTFCDLGQVTTEATATVSGAVDEVVVAMLASDVLAIAVTPDVGGAMLPPVSSIETAAPLPGILMAGPGGPRPPPNPPNPPGPPNCPDPPPPQGCPCDRPPCGPCDNPPCGPPPSPSGTSKK